MAKVKTLPLAPNGIFQTIQGEGALIGTPMVFIRLAGCSIGCPLCDTDYSVGQRLTPAEIAKQADDLRTPGVRYAWITGGEPTDHNLRELISELGSRGFFIALATAGHKAIDSVLGIDWLSVSPHDPVKWVQKRGDELKLVPGLNGFHLSDFVSCLQDISFRYRYVSICDGKPETMTECVDWVESRHGWALTIQAHKIWGIP